LTSLCIASRAFPSLRHTATPREAPPSLRPWREVAGHFGFALLKRLRPTAAIGFVFPPIVQFKLADSMAPSGSGLPEKSSPFFRFPFPSRSASVLAQKGHRRRSRAPYRLRRERAAISVAAQGDVVGCRQSAGNCCHRSPTRKPRQGSQSSTPSDRTFHTWARSRSRAPRLSQSD